MQTTDVLFDAFNRIPPLARRAVDGFDTRGLAFRPDADANSIGWLIWHLTRVQDHHMAQLAERDQAYLEGWATRMGRSPNPQDIGFGHTSSQVEATRFDDPAVLIDYLDVVQARSLDYIAGLDATELSRVIDTNWDPPVTVGIRIVSVIGDCMQHLGQAAYIRGLWDRR